jgi:hypothetical protein
VCLGDASLSQLGQAGRSYGRLLPQHQRTPRDRSHRASPAKTSQLYV